MNRIGVFYATREGQAHKVADHLARALIARGLEVAVHEVREPECDAVLAQSDGVVVVGSVHLGKHEPELVAFVRAHRARLGVSPAAFISVCGAESGVEQGATQEARAASTDRVNEQLRRFAAETGWHPLRVVPVAGALLYTHYNPLVRWVMKQIAKQEALPTDTSRDYEFTDWSALEDVADRIADDLHAG